MPVSARVTPNSFISQVSCRDGNRHRAPRAQTPSLKRCVSEMDGGSVPPLEIRGTGSRGEQRGAFPSSALAWKMGKVEGQAPVFPREGLPRERVSSGQQHRDCLFQHQFSALSSSLKTSTS